jgi:hypothetical protein
MEFSFLFGNELWGFIQGRVFTAVELPGRILLRHVRVLGVIMLVIFLGVDEAGRAGNTDWRIGTDSFLARQATQNPVVYSQRATCKMKYACNCKLRKNPVLTGAANYRPNITTQEPASFGSCKTQNHIILSSTNYIRKPELSGLNPQANYTDRASDRRLSAKLLPIFADYKVHVISVTDPYGCILGFLDRSRYFFLQVAPQLYSRR